MPATVMLVDSFAKEEDIDAIFAYLQHIDDTFSTYKPTSEISQVNEGVLQKSYVSEEVKKIFTLCEETKKATNGFFDMERNGKIDPSGIVKGYAIHEAANILREKEYKNFSVEIAGDVEVAGKNDTKGLWRIGIENPFNRKEIIKVIQVTDVGVATSGTYIRGKHIYNPVEKKDADDIISITVVGSNAYEADRFATAAFAMGEKGILFIESLQGFEGYMITKDQKATYTNGFDKLCIT